MTFARTLTLCLTLWLVIISFLHACLNWGAFDKQPEGRAERAKFKVGYLPVT
jgi:hypothetical protein